MQIAPNLEFHFVPDPILIPNWTVETQKCQITREVEDRAAKDSFSVWIWHVGS